jgi:hypothetical protein
MISAKELRIGNYIYDYEYLPDEALKAIQVDGYMIEKMWLNKSNEYEPIPLTAENIGKCGFESYGDNKEYFKHDNLTGLEFLDQSTDFKVFDTGSVVLTHLKYLHQLQNLYFALTGEELKINRTHVNKID